MRRKPKLEGLLKIDREKVLKKTAGEDEEKLVAMGQESETKAAPWVMEEGKTERHEEAERQAESEWKLSDARGKIITYQGLLFKELEKLMDNWKDEVAPGWYWQPRVTKKGLALFLRDPGGKYFGRGMKVSGIPKYDLNGIFRMVMDAVEKMKPKEEPKVVLN